MGIGIGCEQVCQDLHGNDLTLTSHISVISVVQGMAQEYNRDSHNEWSRVKFKCTMKTILFKVN